MSHRSEMSSKMSYADLEDYEYGHYRDLKYGKVEVRISKSRYVCPYCFGKRKREYNFEELSSHATRIANDPDFQSLKEKTKHLALLKYMERYLRSSRLRDGSISIRDRTEGSKPKEPSPKRGRIEPASKSGLLLGLESQQISDLKPSSNIDCKTGPSSFVKPERLMDVKNKKPASFEAHCVNSNDDDREFVWPWKGIVANIKTERIQGQRVGESGTKLRIDLASKGFNPLRVHVLWSRMGHSGFALVEFDKDWTGFSNAMKFEKHFAQAHRGKKDYYKSRQLGDQLFGWVARDDDYKSTSIVGDHLRKTGDLKTASAKQEEEDHRTTMLMSNLANTLEVKNKLKEEIENKLSKTLKKLNMRVKEKDEMVKQHNEEYKRVVNDENYRLQKICQDHERATAHLESKRIELEDREKQLKLRQVHSEAESLKILQERKMNEKASIEQKKADENMMRLAEEQKKEKENLRERIIELEKKMDAKQVLELEIERMRGALKVMQHMDGEDVEVKNKIGEISEKLKENEEDLDLLESLNQALIIKERKSNDELQGARKELITAIEQLTTRAYIGIKRMGELDSKPFFEASKQKFSEEDVDAKALELCSQWEEYLRDPSWHPFRMIVTEAETVEEIIDEDDEKLKNLKEEYGDQVFKVVTTALMETNAYNPSGRYVIKELWNFREGRRSSLREGVEFLLTLWKRCKSRKN